MQAPIRARMVKVVEKNIKPEEYDTHASLKTIQNLSVTKYESPMTQYFRSVFLTGSKLTGLRPSSQHRVVTRALIELSKNPECL